ncbi:nuclease [Paenibacillus sp. BJ-4]|uniref:nuclease n=1 Tax=Paenibacillus sp. BJ-4 TaxID=2878097 RepID=UPI001CF03FC1|nr:nuclease [Paenibacillus sp. BJ-4]
MKSIKGLIVSAILAVTMGLVAYNGIPVPQAHKAPAASEQSKTVTTGETVRLEFPSGKYPETAQHIKEAIAAGIPNVCTIDRGGVFKNREISLETVPVKKGYKRGQWSLATCTESKVGADVSYISPKDDEGANSWIDQHLEDYSDGTRVEFIIK